MPPGIADGNHPGEPQRLSKFDGQAFHKVFELRTALGAHGIRKPIDRKERVLCRGEVGTKTDETFVSPQKVLDLATLIRKAPQRGSETVIRREFRH